ncbi:hypothetical protein JCM5350_007627 [Sporobolomyces pararoseus]
MSNRSMRPTPSNASFASTSISHHSTNTSTSSSEASVSIFRHLNFVASIPIQFTLAPSNSSTTTTGDSSSSEIQTYFLQVPRISYLGLILPTIQNQFLSLITGDKEKEREGTKQVWFQDEQTKEFLKPHWPIGLMYDYHHSTNHHSLPSQASSSSHSTSENVAPDSLASVFAPFDSPSLLAPPSFTNEYNAIDSNQTLRGVPSSRASDRSASSSSHYHDRQSFPSSSSTSTRTTLNPWKILIHLSPPQSSSSATLPQGISTNGSNTLQETKNQLMNRLKESDYLRFGNSKKKLVNLKKEEQDSLWYGIVHNDFTKFWTVGNKLIPLPSTSSNFSATTTTSYEDQTVTQNGNGTGADGDLKNLAIKIYLPPIGGEVGGGKVLNSPTSPLDPRTGQPTTLQSYLSSVLPLLFPTPSTSSSTIRSTQATSSSPKAFAIIQGIVVPIESELSWLTSCLGGTDGWLSIVIAIRD